eukprot:TRINITY_DN113368_c0_g1_i1.p1 TRINITY_DN113368_c0_g1~~TRINITY_DN113368_c0_g1_i1.p1  ORF type:complete len:343 (-),score=77.84 TRINITY_DN113368_c0_g1_i1:81-977(-)
MADSAATLEQFEKLDPKTQLVQFCQRKTTGKTVTPGDIVYTTNKFPQGMQAMVKLVCIGGQEFAGELASTAKDAERNAAKQAMAAFRDEIPIVMAPGYQKGVKRKLPGQPSPAPAKPAKQPKMTPGVLGGGLSIPAGAGALNVGNKTELNAHISKIVRGVMEKNHVLYEYHEVIGGGFQATVKCSCLPGVWAQRTFVGEVEAKKGDAEQSAAGVCLAAIKADVGLMSKYAAPPKPKNWTPGQGKGGGKGRPASAASSQASIASLYGQQQVLALQQASQVQGWDRLPSMGLGFGMGMGF